MGTYRNPGSAGTADTGASLRLDVGKSLIEGIDAADKDIRDKRTLVRTFESEADKRRDENLEKITNLEEVEGYGPAESLLDELRQRVDNDYRLDYQTFGGDRSAYEKATRDTQKVVGNITGVNAALDGEFENWENMSEQQKNQMIRRSSFAGENGEKREKFKELLDNPEKMGYKLKGDQIIITLNGEEVLNGTEYLNSRKKGFELVELTNDFEKELGEVSDQAYKGIDNLKEIIEIQEDKGDYTESRKTTIYNNAIENFKENLNAESNSSLKALIGEDMFQRFVDPNGEEVYSSSPETDAKIKEEMVNYLVQQRFPEEVVENYYKEVDKDPLDQTAKKLNNEIRRIKLKEKKEELKDDDYENVFKVEKDLATGIKQSDDPLNEYYKALMAASSGQDTKTYVNQDGVIYRVDQGKFKDSPPTYTPIMNEGKLKEMSTDDLIIRLNKDKGNIIPNNKLNSYLGNEEVEVVEEVIEFDPNTSYKNTKPETPKNFNTQEDIQKAKTFGEGAKLIDDNFTNYISNFKASSSFARNIEREAGAGYVARIFKKYDDEDLKLNEVILNIFDGNTKGKNYSDEMIQDLKPITNYFLTNYNKQVSKVPSKK
tara:strand:- start:552 stop:2354 length:1803 start_codon:yes stop_codon:yes gene_type:complete